MTEENRWLGAVNVYQGKKSGTLVFTCLLCENGYDTPLQATKCCRDEKIEKGWGNLLGAEE